jgi:hypothetical protein
MADDTGTIVAIVLAVIAGVVLLFVMIYYFALKKLKRPTFEFTTTNLETNEYETPQTAHSSHQKYEQSEFVTRALAEKDDVLRSVPKSTLHTGTHGSRFFTDNTPIERHRVPIYFDEAQYDREGEKIITFDKNDYSNVF